MDLPPVLNLINQIGIRGLLAHVFDAVLTVGASAVSLSGVGDDLSVVGPKTPAIIIRVVTVHFELCHNLKDQFLI